MAVGSQSKQTMAFQIKRAIGNQIKGKPLAPLSNNKSPFHNPIAQSLLAGEFDLSLAQEDQINEFESTAKLVLTKVNYNVLLRYFKERRQQNDKLGRLFQSMNFEQFILRLLHKRFKSVYFDGRVIVLRDNTTKHQHGKQFLENLGTDKDIDHDYREYLTLEEAMLSPLIIPQVTSVIIGTGRRSTEDKWDVKGEFRASVHAALVSYPAAVELRNGATAHYDALFVVKPKRVTQEYKDRVKLLRKNEPLMTAARVIYGDSFAFDDNEFPEQRYLTITENNETYYLNKEAYLTRTKHMLKTTLQAADVQMRRDQLGKTFQLKGLGLGAFSFSGADNVAKIQTLYLEALQSVLEDKHLNLTHIKRINLINLPNDLQNDYFRDGSILKEAKINGINLFRSVMNPTYNLNKHRVGNIGGVVVCGDSGSMFGNEGNIGLDRSSSDDPAAQYSLLDPQILNPESNKHLRDKECIRVIEKGEFKRLPDMKFKTVKLPKLMKRTVAEPIRDLLFAACLFSLGFHLISSILLVGVAEGLFALQMGITFGLASLFFEGVRHFNVRPEIPYQKADEDMQDKAEDIEHDKKPAKNYTPAQQLKKKKIVQAPEPQVHKAQAKRKYVANGN